MSISPHILPEIFLPVAGCVLLLVAAIERCNLRLISWLTAGVFLCAAVLVFSVPEGRFSLFDLSIVDELARYGKMLVLSAGALSLVLAPSYMRDVGRYRPEYPVLLLFAILGMLIMISASHFLTLYLGLEIQNLALYVLVAFCREDKKGSEAALKYYILGAVSSAVLLFGLSLLYGATGSLDFAALAAGKGTGLALGLVFVLVGFAFKLAAVPFHMWAPDVYEGAPTPVTAFLLAAPKVAGLIVVARLFLHPMMTEPSIWQPLLIVFSLLSMFLGALGGLAQQNINRLLAYSAITNVGVMLVGLVLLGQSNVAAAGFSGTLLYLALYLMGTIGFFAGVLMLRKEGAALCELKDLSGLLKTHPLLASSLCASLFSLAGIPPLAGFFGKYKVFLAAVEGGEMTLAVLGVLASVIAAAYYLRVIKIMAFDPPPEKDIIMITDRPLYAVCVLSGIAVVGFMISPAPLMDAAQRAAESLF
ncbi:MAG: NADH-quinone oxidoreductase subunit N [Bdellovibrionales bacterium]